MSIPENRAVIPVRVHPNQARNEIAGSINGVIRVNISAPPLKGKANRELVAYLSRLLGISKDSISIIKGHTARNKLVAIDGMSRDSVMKLLLPAENI
jgi:uncharacterized protein (TIGR00251 family)